MRGFRQNSAAISTASSTGAPISPSTARAPGASHDRSTCRRCMKPPKNWSAGTTSPPSAPPNAKPNRRSRRSTGWRSSARATRCASTPPPARSCTTRCARWWARWCWSATANGAPTILPPRSRHATAAPAARSRRPTGSISWRWSIDSGGEIFFQNPPIDGGEAGDLGDGAADELDEARRLCEEHVGVGRLPVDAPAGASGRRGGAALDQGLQRITRMVIVEADVEARAHLGRDHVDGAIAHIDRSELEVGRVEMRAALVERLVHERAHDAHDAADRVVGTVRIGDMALLAVGRERAVERAAPPDLYDVAQRLRAGRLAENAVVEGLAALGRPVEQLDRAVDRDVLLVAGDEEGDRARKLATDAGEIIERRRHEAGDAALHVDGAAAEQ